MRTAWTIGARELSSLFRLPVGWVSIALYLLLAGLVFGWQALQPGQPATLRQFFALSGWLLLPVAPAISMRLFSEEYRAGTFETLTTSPASDAAVVAGKFGAAFAFLVLMLVPTLAYPAILTWASDPRPDLGPVAAGYLSLLLLGAMFLALGTVASALTSNQTLAFLATFLVLLALMLGPVLLADQARPGLRDALLEHSPARRAQDLAKGVIDTGHVAFFAAWTAWLLVMAWLALGSRRWR